MLKPADSDPRVAAWHAETMDGIVEDGFRVARPLRTTDGAWVHSGWTASVHVAGAEAGEGRWLDIVGAGHAFHQAIAHFPRPEFLDRRSNHWHTGDQVAWQEQEPDLVPELRAPYERLAGLRGSFPEARSQLVHGDLTGNVLFHPHLPPAVIDFSPYWRPSGYAEAVVIADALIWHGAGPDLLRQTKAGILQYLVRAVIFRLVTTSERVKARITQADVRQYSRAAELIAAYSSA